MNQQIRNLRQDIDHDIERLKTLELEIEDKRLQIAMISTSIYVKQQCINLIEDSMTQEIFRAEIDLRFPPVPVNPLPVGSIVIEEGAAG